MKTRLLTISGLETRLLGNPCGVVARHKPHADSAPRSQWSFEAVASLARSRTLSSSYTLLDIQKKKGKRSRSIPLPRDRNDKCRLIMGANPLRVDLGLAGGPLTSDGISRSDQAGSVPVNTLKPGALFVSKKNFGRS